MSAATYQDFRQAWDGLTPEQQKRIRDKARYERVTVFGVWHEWPSLFA